MESTLDPTNIQDSEIIAALKARKITALLRIFYKYGDSVKHEIMSLVPQEEMILPAYLLTLLKFWELSPTEIPPAKEFAERLMKTSQNVAKKFPRSWLWQTIIRQQEKEKEAAEFLSSIPPNTTQDKIIAADGHLGRKLKAVRKGRNLSLEDVAHRLGCSPRDVSEIERRSILAQKFVLRVTKALEVPEKLIARIPPDGWIGDPYNPIGKKIIYAAKQKRLTKQALADRLNIGTPALARIEALSEMPVERAMKIAKALRMTLFHIEEINLQGPEEIEMVGNDANPLGYKIWLFRWMQGLSADETAERSSYGSSYIHLLEMRPALRRDIFNKLAIAINVSPIFISNVQVKPVVQTKITGKNGQYIGSESAPIGPKIAQIRMGKEISIGDLADKMGHTVNTIKLIEGSKTITGRKLLGVANALGVHPDEIIEATIKDKRTIGTVQFPIGPKIRHIRLQKNIKKKDFAAKLEVSEPTISKIEHAASISKALFAQIAKVLNATQLEIIQISPLDESTVGGNGIHMGANIKYHRERRGMTQSELAKKANLSSYNMILKIEKREKLPTNLVQLIAKILRIPATDLYIDSSNKKLKVSSTYFGTERQPIGPRIKAIRESYEMSYAKFAEKIKVDPKTLFKMERRTAIRGHALFKMSKNLNMPFEDLLYSPTLPNALTKEIPLMEMVDQYMRSKSAKLAHA